ncbi:TetR/AcrR family transcriptional regulator [Kitasatospora kifunensis]|uniref:AcrR family transcriptional regulator n=1 Tax=Kitasatospora kifunensis TaxID=58351 RepID=A0A7W7R4A3_KITKI|nr:TetR/AcrR family transcriptional regulator [Kitasatospora kifunensis]MBB4924965.1 AcrR family transcriptional regulator [Kitasatospora kifunensis]
MVGDVAGRGRRPRGRRMQILAVAAEQFHRRGYHQVAMAEVAAAVGITAPALYRHYRGKPELLRQAVRAGLDELAAAVRQVADRPTSQESTSQEPTARGPAALAQALAGVALDQRALGTLWQRDARLLPPAQRAELRRTLRSCVRTAGRLLAAARPELTSVQAELILWSALSVAGSLSYHTFAPPRRRFERLLTELLLGILTASPGPPLPVLPGRATAGGPPGRREELLAAAVRLFDEHGFDNVSTDRLGAAVGIAGPSLYKHFPAKGDLLAAALVRCRERLGQEVVAVLLAAGEQEERLELGLRAYVAFARRHRHYLGAMVSETERLAEPDRKAALDFRRDFLRIWVELLREVRPDYDKVEARIRVHAMFALVNDGVRNSSPAMGGQLAPRLDQLAGTLLGLPGRRTAAGVDPHSGPPLTQRLAN